MARPIWRGVISFGMVTIPVKLFTATETKDVSFHLLHEEDHSRLRFLRWCPEHEREVGKDEIVRGYEYGKDQYVILTDGDFERLPLSSRHTIELTAFVNAGEIDPIYYESSYYLEPEETGLKPYALLMRALLWKGQIALAQVALRNKERLCALRPYGGTLMLETLHYPDEIRVEQEAELPELAISKQELGMAFTFIDLLSAPFQPEKYHDQYREAVMEIIEAKLQGHEVVEAPPPGVAKVTDLMEALRASVEAAKRRKEQPPPEELRRARAAG